MTTLGDLLLDVIVRLAGPLVPGADQVAETRVGAGGQAANVAAWAAELGAEARFVGKRGADAAGELAARELRGHGVEVAGPAEGRNGVVVSFSSVEDRTMASDRGAAPELTPDELDAAWFDCDALHLSGYSLHREPMASAALARGGAGARERRASVDRPRGLDGDRRRRSASGWRRSRPISCSRTSASATRSATSTRAGS